jgi:hypothetical protein
MAVRVSLASPSAVLLKTGMSSWSKRLGSKQRRWLRSSAAWNKSVCSTAGSATLDLSVDTTCVAPCRWIAPFVLLCLYVLFNLLNVCALTFLPPPPQPPPAPPIQEKDYHLSRECGTSNHSLAGSSWRKLPGASLNGSLRGASFEGTCDAANEATSTSASADEIALPMPPSDDCVEVAACQARTVACDC